MSVGRLLHENFMLKPFALFALRVRAIRKLHHLPKSSKQTPDRHSSAQRELILAKNENKFLLYLF
jgi:hypothetical protein